MRQRQAGQKYVETLPHVEHSLSPPLRRAVCPSLPLRETFKKAPEDVPQGVGVFEPRQVAHLGKLDIAGRRDDLGELQGDPGRTRIALPMHNQRGSPQSGELLGQRPALGKVLGSVAEELIDLEIDVQAIDQQLLNQLPRSPAVSDVGGPGQLAVGPLDFVKLGPLRGSETCSQVSQVAQVIGMKQCRPIGTVLRAPVGVNARPGQIQHRPNTGGMGEAIGQGKRGSPGMPQDDPLREPPMLAQGLQVSDGGGDVVGRAASRKREASLMLRAYALRLSITTTTLLASEY